MQHNPNVLYQHGTLALLVPGLLKGTITMGEFLNHGDTGIGTGEGLDGELIILDGTPYQVSASGEVNVVSADFTMPFANTNWANYKPLFEAENVAQGPFSEQILELMNNNNTFFSVVATGEFSNVTTRAVAKSNTPYKTLAETAEQQSIFKRDKVSGTLLGYYSPELFNGAAVGGFHYHFLSKEKDFGGHVLGFTVDKADITAQVFDTLEQHLPVADQDYRNHDFSTDDIAGSIEKSEK
ncbi:acetolactate decarboxylase [Lentilactobacillus sp. Marseille-Q4993]|uniref:acetolactate decarboxylase n=1 Tax=Lentilactobacillus sp. Marseille-Q4993 TaxID=3039492 RepID=UPI0024BD39C3|nr:acetolactate decarboxylase [Lentilactobacillus sp. Marseille-Q4993]